MSLENMPSEGSQTQKTTSYAFHSQAMSRMGKPRGAESRLAGARGWGGGGRGKDS